MYINLSFFADLSSKCEEHLLFYKIPNLSCFFLANTKLTVFWDIPPNKVRKK